jgi:hypothetical protein
VVAVGDVHGSHAEFVEVLRLAGVVDAKERWAGGKTHFVQTGDILDRGAETKAVMELLMRLEGEARKAGGRVHALLGNHEAMNVLGDLRYVLPEEYKSFTSSRSRELWQQFYESRRELARDQAAGRGERFDEAAFRTSLEQDAPLGFVERIRAFSDEGRYGRWLRERRAIVRIDGTVFLHGGLTPEVAALGCEQINATVRRELTRDIAKTREQPLASLAAAETGPLWFRGGLGAGTRAGAGRDWRIPGRDRAHGHRGRPDQAPLRRARDDDRRRHEPALRPEPRRARAAAGRPGHGALPRPAGRAGAAEGRRARRPLAAARAALPPASSRARRDTRVTR